jgi:hypothetical protein
MIELRPFKGLGGADHGWLKSYHSFSFADYWDPRHVEFGPLRVIIEGARHVAGGQLSYRLDVRNEDEIGELAHNFNSMVDALQETHGEVYGITDPQAAAAKKLFEQSEEIDILNAPAIAVAALQQAVISGSVQPKDIILLNITGGGVARIREEHTLHRLMPQITVSHWEQTVEFLEGKK